MATPLGGNRADSLLLHKMITQYFRFNVFIDGHYPLAREVVPEYIHNNPVKRGYVDLPEHWRYSSARAYAGQDTFLPVVLL